MSKPKEKRLKLAVQRLVPGLFVDLELTWKQHPFLFRRFKIKTAEEIAVIKQLWKQLEQTEIIVLPERSDAKVPKANEQSSGAETAAKEGLWEAKKNRIAEAARYRQRRAKVAARYTDTVRKVKRLTQDLNTAPANAMRDAGDVVDSMVEAFEGNGDILVNLVNLSDSSFSFYHHSLNVTVLSMVLGRALGLSSDELRDLGMGAMLHDIGKALVPSQLLKKPRLNASESKLLQTHTSLGGKLARRIEVMHLTSIPVIEQHHEYLDGTGYPHGLKGDAISRLAKIVAITNLYDDLCNPVDPANALPPKAVMAILFAKYKAKLDGEMVQRLIACMGVYPPGTVVTLSDDSIGLVTAVDTKALLKPQVLLYNPDIPAREALALDLTQYPELSIVGILKPGDYDRRIYDYLGIQERVGYFYETLV